MLQRLIIAATASTTTSPLPQVSHHLCTKDGMILLLTFCHLNSNICCKGWSSLPPLLPPHCHHLTTTMSLLSSAHQRLYDFTTDHVIWILTLVAKVNHCHHLFTIMSLSSSLAHGRLYDFITDLCDLNSNPLRRLTPSSSLGCAIETSGGLIDLSCMSVTSCNVELLLYMWGFLCSLFCCPCAVWLSESLFVCVPEHLLSTRLTVCWCSICLVVWLSACMVLCWLVCLIVYLSGALLVWLSVCLMLCWFVCLIVCVSDAMLVSVSDYLWVWWSDCLCVWCYVSCFVWLSMHLVLCWYDCLCVWCYVGWFVWLSMSLVLCLFVCLILYLSDSMIVYVPNPLLVQAIQLSMCLIACTPDPPSVGLHMHLIIYMSNCLCICVSVGLLACCLVVWLCDCWCARPLPVWPSMCLLVHAPGPMLAWLPVHPMVYVSDPLMVCWFDCLCICWSLFQNDCMSDVLSLGLAVCLLVLISDCLFAFCGSIDLFTWLSVALPTCLMVSLSLCLTAVCWFGYIITWLVSLSDHLALKMTYLLCYLHIWWLDSLVCP